MEAMSDGQTAGVPIHIDAGTIEESIQRTLDEAYANVPDGHYELRRALFTEAKAQSEIAQTYSRVLQLVLYLCAQNAEIAPNSEQAVYTRRSATIKDRYAEIQKWDVGVRSRELNYFAELRIGAGGFHIDYNVIIQVFGPTERHNSGAVITHSYNPLCKYFDHVFCSKFVHINKNRKFPILPVDNKKFLIYA